MRGIWGVVYESGTLAYLTGHMSFQCRNVKDPYSPGTMSQPSLPGYFVYHQKPSEGELILSRGNSLFE